jgi:lipopolysaccharide exporter
MKPSMPGPGSGSGTSLTRRAARGAAWTISSSLVSRAVGLVGTLVLVRFVAPESYGEASAAVVVVGTINQLSSAGVGIYAIATRDATPSDLYHATLIHLCLGVLAFFGLLFLAKPLSPFFGAPEMYRYVPALACAALADRLAFMPERVLIRRLGFRRVSLIRSVGELSYAVVSVTAAARGMGALAIVIGNVSRSCVKMVATLASVDRREWFEVRPVQGAVLRKIGRYGFLMSLGHLGYYATLKWDNLMVSRYFGAAVMGAYNLAYSLAEIPSTHVAEQITDVMEASYAHMAAEERRSALLRSFGIIALVTFPLTVGLGSVAPTLAGLFLDKRWSGTGAILMALATMFIVRPPYAAVTSYITVQRGPRPVIVLEWVTVAALLTGLFTVGRISPLWACAAVGVAFGLRAVLGMYVAAVSSRIPLSALARQLVLPLVGCAFMVGGVYAARAGLAALGVRAPVPHLVLEILAGAVVYVAAVLLFAPAAARDLLRLGRRAAPAAEPAPALAVEPRQSSPGQSSPGA